MTFSLESSKENAEGVTIGAQKIGNITDTPRQVKR